MASIVQLQYALELSRQGSFQKAAQKCFVTQPTLSMQIQKLEEEYGITIFDRTRKPTIPTAEGQRLLEQFSRVCREFDGIKEIANAAKGEVAGTYHLGIIPTIAPYLLPKLYPQLKKNFPKIELSIKEIPTESIVEQLIHGEIDGGLLATPLRQPALKETKILYESFYLFHSKQLTLPTQNKKISPADFPLDKLLLLTEGNCLRTQTLDMCKIDEEAKGLANFSIQAASLMTLINMIRTGPFFTLLPELAVKSLSKSEQEQQIKSLKGTTPVREISLVVHRSAAKSSISQVITKTLKALNLGSKSASHQIIAPQ